MQGKAGNVGKRKRKDHGVGGPATKLKKSATMQTGQQTAKPGPKPKISQDPNLFINRLNSKDPLPAMQEIVNSENQDELISEFFNSGGQVSSLTRGLEYREEKPKLNDIATVFSACHTILMSIAKSEDPKASYGGRGFSFALELCRTLLDEYNKEIMSMLSSQTGVFHVKSALKLLTAMVTLGPAASKLVVMKLDWENPAWRNLPARVDAKDDSDIRTCYIHFLLSFLVEPTQFVLKEYFEKKTRLATIFPGLVNDKPELVMLVLETLRTKVVETVLVAKTYKMKLFGSFSLKNLLELFNWKGPKQGADIEDREEEKEEIVGALNELFKLLLTNTKYGVVFQDPDYACEKSINNLVVEFLQNLLKPWSKKELARLTADILVANPGEIPAYLDKHKQDRALAPRDSDVWKKLVDMYFVIFKELSIEKIVSNYKNTNKIAMHILKNIVFSQTLLYDLILPGLKDEKLVVVRKSVELLDVTLQKAQDFIKQADDSSLQEEFKSLCEKMLPKYDRLITIWQKEIGSGESKHLNCIISIIALRIKLFGQEEGSAAIVDMLKDLKDVQIAKPIDEDESFDPRIHLLSIVTNILSTDDKTDSLSFLSSFLSAETIAILLNCLKSSCEVEANTARAALRIISRSTGISLDDCLDLDLMLDLLTDPSLVSDLSLLIWSAIVNVKNLEQEIMGYKSISLSNEKVDEIFEALMKNEDLPVEIQQTESKKAVSPLILCLLDNMSQEKLKEYSAQFLESLFVASFAKNDGFKILKERCQSLSQSEIKKYQRLSEGQSTDKSLSWLEKNEAVKYTGLGKAFASKLVALDDNEGLKTFLEDVTQEDNRAKIVEYLFSDENMENFNLFCKKLDDPILMLLPYVNKLDLEVTNFAKMVVSQAEAVMEKKDVKHFDLSRVLKAFDMTSFQLEQLLPILEKLSEQGVNKFLSDTGKLNQRGALLVSCIKAASKSSLSTEKLSPVFAKLTSHLEFLLEKLPEDLILPEALLALVQNHASVCDQLSINILYVLTQGLNQQCKRQILVNLVKASAKMSEGLLEWLAKVKEDSVPDAQVLALTADFISAGWLANIIGHKKAVKNLMKKSTSCITSNIGNLDATSNSDDKTLEHAIYFIKSISSDVYSSKTVGIVQTFFNENKEELKSLLSNKDLSFYKKKIAVEFAYHVLTILEHSESNIKKLMLNYVLIPILESLPSAWSQGKGTSDEEKAEIIGLCKIGLSTALAQSYSAVRNHLKKHTETWSTFIKCILKHGLKDSEVGVAGVGLLTAVCSLRYSTQVDQENWDDEDTQEMGLIVDMILSHSAYLKILLSPSSELKEKVMNLLVSLAPASCRQEQLEPLLAGYTGTLHPSDIAILQLLCTMESNGVNVTLRKPMMFGPQAVSQLAVNGQTVQTNKFSDCLSVMKPDIMLKTVTSFPMSLPLDPMAEWEGLDSSTNNLYDPRFILPYLSSLTGQDVYIDRHMKMVESNIISLALMSLASHDPDMRSNGYHVLHRFYVKMQESKLLAEKQIWLHLVDLVKNGLARASDNKVCFKLPGITTLFLARCCAIIQNPTHFMYGKLTAFLLAKPFLELFHVPDFVRLLHSSEVNPKQQQMWILGVIRDGLRSGLDHHVLMQDHVYKLILSKVSSCLADRMLLYVGLEILEAATRVSAAVFDLVGQLGLLQWINLIVNELDEEKELEIIIKIYTNIEKGLKPVDKGETKKEGEEADKPQGGGTTLLGLLKCNLHVLNARLDKLKLNNESSELYQSFQKLGLQNL